MRPRLITVSSAKAIPTNAMEPSPTWHLSLSKNAVIFVKPDINAQIIGHVAAGTDVSLGVARGLWVQIELPLKGWILR